MIEAAYFLFTMDLHEILYHALVPNLDSHAIIWHTTNSLRLLKAQGLTIQIECVRAASVCVLKCIIKYKNVHWRVHTRTGIYYYTVLPGTTGREIRLPVEAQEKCVST